MKLFRGLDRRRGVLLFVFGLLFGWLLVEAIPIGTDPSIWVKLALVVTLGLAIAALSAWLVTRPHARSGRPVGRWEWLFLAAPPLVVWTIYLLALWPGVLTPDSMFQWSQVLSGRFDNWHPAFHTMTEWLISLPARTPASVALVQIVALSGVVGWGLASMRRLGLPAAAAWMISLVFAFWPSNGALVVTLWKDIPYAITVLALGVVLLREVDGRHPVLDRIPGQLLVGMLALLAALFHHAGPAVAVGSLLALGVDRSWRAVLMPAIGALVVFGLVQGPLFGALVVTTPSPPHDEAAVMHHLAAHMAAGTALEPEEAEFVVQNPYLSDTSWYQCDTVTPLITRPDFSVARLEVDAAESRRLLLSLLTRNPRVDWVHTKCSSQLVWKIRRLPGAYHYGAGFRRLDDGPLSTIVDNPHGLHRDSVIPALTDPLADAVLASEHPGTAWLWWRAPLMLYLLVFGVVIAALRSGSWRYLLVAVPAASVALTLVLAAPAQDFRYVYPVFVSGLLLAPYLAFYAPRRQGVRSGSTGV